MSTVALFGIGGRLSIRIFIDLRIGMYDFDSIIFLIELLPRIDMTTQIH